MSDDQSVASTIMSSAANSLAPQYGIAEAASMTQVAEATLRLWETRYHWPNPVRNESGYRLYSEDLINDIIRMANLVANGHKIRELIEGGKPLWPTALVPKPERQAYDFSAIPIPESDEGQIVRKQTEEAIRNQDRAKIRMLKEHAILLPPQVRKLAITDLLEVSGWNDQAPTTPSVPPAKMADETSVGAQPQVVDTLSEVEPETLVVTPEPIIEAPSVVSSGSGFSLRRAVLSNSLDIGVSLNDAATTVGVYPSCLEGIIYKGARVNQRTADRFAKWLGVSAEIILSSQEQGRAKRQSPAEGRGRKGKAIAQVQASVRDKGDDSKGTSAKDRNTAKSALVPPRKVAAKAAMYTIDQVLAIVKEAIDKGGKAQEAKKVLAPSPHPVFKDNLAMKIHKASSEMRKYIKLAMEFQRHLGRK